MLSSHTHLVEHSTHCPVALNMFLKCQPKYWCFVPMADSDADLDDAKYSDHQNRIVGDVTLPDVTSIGSVYQRSPTLIRWCMDHLPTPPANYRFSERQRMEQYDFFLSRCDLYPTRFLDMYNATIVVACKFIVQLCYVLHLFFLLSFSMRSTGSLFG